MLHVAVLDFMFAYLTLI